LSILTSDDSTGKTIATVQTDSVTASGTVHLDFASVWGEAIRWVLSCDTALEGETARRDVVLGQSELLERRTGGDLDLGSDNVDAGNFFGDGMLDLTIGSC
jgi:hypothetical protein